MSQVSVKGTIDGSANDVWRTISDFEGVGKYLPAVIKSVMEGSGVGAVRRLRLQDGVQVVERLESLDQQARVLSYTIIDAPLPFEGYVSTMRVRDLGAGRCELEWSSTFEPKGAPEAEVKKMIEDLYWMGFDELKKMHGN